MIRPTSPSGTDTTELLPCTVSKNTHEQFIFLSEVSLSILLTLLRGTRLWAYSVPKSGFTQTYFKHNYYEEDPLALVVGGELLGLRPVFPLTASAPPCMITFLMLFGWCHSDFEFKIGPLCELKLVPSSTSLVRTFWYAFKILTSKKSSNGLFSKVLSGCSFTM